MSQTVLDGFLFAVLYRLNKVKLLSMSSIAAFWLLEICTVQPAQAKVQFEFKAENAQNVAEMLPQQSFEPIHNIAQLPRLPVQEFVAPPNFNVVAPALPQHPQTSPGVTSPQVLPTAPAAMVPVPGLNPGVNAPSGYYNSQYAPPGVVPVAAPQYIQPATQTWQQELSRTRYPYPYSPPVAAPPPNAIGNNSIPQAPGNAISPGVMLPYGMIGQPYWQPVPANSINPSAMLPYNVMGQAYILVVPVATPMPPAGGNVAPNATGSNLNPGAIAPYLPTTATPLPVPVPPAPQPNNIGGNILPPLPGTLNQGGIASYVPAPMMQQQYVPFNAPPANVSGSPTQSYLPPVPNTFNPNGGVPYAPVGQQPYLAPVPTQLPPTLSAPTQNPPNTNVAPVAPRLNTTQGTIPPASNSPLNREEPVNTSALQLQGIYLYQGDESSARARVGAVYPLAPRILVGATLDLTDGNAFADSRTQGLSINELYLATSLENVPNLRFVIGQLDLTSYFDRNSFAKDGASQFFNPVFQTNPALVTTGLNSRPGALVNWSITDNIEAKAAIFSSSRAIGDFALDGFATELGIRYGNAIIRGTYATDRDAGTQDGFQEAFQVARGDGDVGIQRSDREESYGVNAEVYIPNLNMGLFGRYGRYENRDLGLGGDTYSLGVSFFDLFTPDDRLGLAYGRSLSNDKLRRQADNDRPDVLELYYDFRFLSNLRLGFTVQERNDFSETVFGFRVKTEFNVTPIESIIR